MNKVEKAFVEGLLRGATLTPRKENDMSYDRRRGRMGRDQAEGIEEVKKLLDDPNTDYGDLIATIIENAGEEKQMEIAQAIGEIAQDKRGPRRWAADRSELRRARDAGTLEKFSSEEDRRWEEEPGEARDRRRGQAHDAVRRRDSAAAEFAEWFPDAAKIERG